MILGAIVLFVGLVAALAHHASVMRRYGGPRGRDGGDAGFVPFGGDGADACGGDGGGDGGGCS